VLENIELLVIFGVIIQNLNDHNFLFHVFSELFSFPTFFSRNNFLDNSFVKVKFLVVEWAIKVNI